jgi:hypothetical protein
MSAYTIDLANPQIEQADFVNGLLIAPWVIIGAGSALD